MLLLQAGWGKDWYDLRGGQTQMKSAAAAVDPIPVKPSFIMTAINKSGSTAQSKNDIDRYTIQFDIPGFSIDKKKIGNEEYSTVRIPDCSWQNSDIGKPEVPVKIVMVPLPSGKKPITKVTIGREVDVVLGQIQPAQKPQIDGRAVKAVPFTKDSAFYASNGAYPSNNIFSSSVVKMRNHRFLSLEISPMTSLPAEGKIRVAAQMSIDVMLENDPASTADADDSLSDPNGFDRFLLNQ
jgi:hypothetical protein